MFKQTQRKCVSTKPIHNPDSHNMSSAVTEKVLFIQTCFFALQYYMAKLEKGKWSKDTLSNQVAEKDEQT